jgi:phosphoribosyl 1,2-cyclic phosphodiesterase
VPEYEQRVGWGHSSTTDVVAFAERAEARRLVLFHHDPLHTDADLEGMLVDARSVRGAEPLDVELGYEGQTFALT